MGIGMVSKSRESWESRWQCLGKEMVKFKEKAG